MIKVTINAKLPDMPEEQVIPAILTRFLNPEVSIYFVSIRGKKVEMIIQEKEKIIGSSLYGMA